MNSTIAGILSLKGEQLDSLIEVLLILVFISSYLIPLIILMRDLKKRYSDKFTRLFLTWLAILGLPLFIIPYILFRKETTLNEDRSIDSELNMLTTSNNCVRCSKCSEINRVDYNYCIKCGNLLIALCRNCGQNIDLNWHHCGYCGANLETIPLLSEPKTQSKITNKIEELEKLKVFGSALLRNKKIIYAISHKLNTLITPSTEVYK